MSDTNAQSFAQLRERAGLSQAQVARVLGVSQEAVAKLERGSNPRVATVFAYSVALGGSAEVTVTLHGKDYTLLFSAPATADTAEVTAWSVRGWNDRAHESACLGRGIIAISNGDEFDESMAAGRSDAELRAVIAERYPDRTARAISVFVGYSRAFGERVTVGDVIAMPLSGHRDSGGNHAVTVNGELRWISGYNVAIGVVTGEYAFVPEEPDPFLRHRRSVDWLAVFPVDNLERDVRLAVNAPGTIKKINADDAAQRVLRIAR
ncbi:helix-turn-helix domain-containing protein [Aldersonia sp. NBC_00410]|uniref:helix-turn-helix domain-containing protein n=1 Tax=Aldersonia sp. NBC_00410 TaxID=2975954 RepID=UPI0022563A1F|nr:helix-turn-helix domain-containing protein [Aldersonia sp. NBC_00410]MCX5042436.1 helix-turn-helix domain-containing protein [Aldersonia sp. NBC_00410]